MKEQYAIMRFPKYMGPEISRIEGHNERTKEKYASNPDIDPSRTHLNFHLIDPAGKYRREAERQIARAQCRTRKDSVRVVETIITCSTKFFKDKAPEEIWAFFMHALDFLEQKQAKETFLSAVVHMDEKTPHMHVSFVPLTADKRLSAKDIIGNRRQLIAWQDACWKHMVAKYPELARGESASITGRTHLPTQVFTQMARLTKKRQRIESVPYREKPYTPEEMAKLVTPERVSLQEDIREELMGLGSAVIDKDGKTSYTGAIKQEKRLDIVIGPPAAGKSSALADWLSQANGSRVLDSDMVKERLPEYEGGLNSGYLHNESRYIWQRMMYEAAENGDNVVLPVVGGSLSSAQKNISLFEDAGYTVNVHFVTLERGKTLSRALGRFLFQGRYISPSYLYDMTDGRIDKTYEALKIGGELDGYSKWSNDVPQGQHPILLESDGIGTEVFQEHHGDSGGREPSVHGGGLGTAQGPSGTAQGGNGETKQ